MLDLYWASAFLAIAFIGSFLLFKSRNDLPKEPEEDWEFKGVAMIFAGVTLGLFFLWECLEASFFAWIHQVIPYASEQPDLHLLTFFAVLFFIYFGIIMSLVMLPYYLGQLYDNKVAAKC